MHASVVRNRERDHIKHLLMRMSRSYVQTSAWKLALHVDQDSKRQITKHPSVVSSAAPGWAASIQRAMIDIIRPDISNTHLSYAACFHHEWKLPMV